MLSRRRFLGTAGAALLAAPLVADAQATGEARRIGVLANTAPAAGLLGPFGQGLRELGWVEGQNLVIESRWTDGRSERLPALADELVRLKVDVIVTPGTAASLAAKNATKTIPIVMISAADPHRMGLVASLARPGGNVTGTSWDVGLDVFAKQLELLKETLPKLQRVAIVANSGNPAQGLAIDNLKTAARSLGLQLQLVSVSGPSEFDRPFGAMKSKQADAVLVAADAMLNFHRARLADLAARHRLPSMYGFRSYVEAGGLMSYGPNLSDISRRAAKFVDRILKGARPADLPVEQPTKFELVINLKMAKTLGLTIPPSLLLRADQVIE